MTRGCAEVELLLPWFAAGTASDDERDAVEAHLSECAGCRELWEQARMQADGPDLASLLASPVAPALLVEWAECPEALPAATRAELRERVLRDPLSRQAFERLKEVEGAAAVGESKASGTSAPVVPLFLRPTAAATYLAAAALLVLAVLVRGPGGTPMGDPLVAAVTIVADSERIQRAAGGVATEPPLVLSETTLLRLRTDLAAEDLADPAASFLVSLESGPTIVWSARRRGGEFTIEPPHAILEVVVFTDRLIRGQNYDVVIRIEKPGDPLDGQALYRRRLTPRGER